MCNKYTVNKVVCNICVCTKCGWRGKSRRKLWTHFRTHTEDTERRRYECNQCGKFFRRSSGRAEHVRNVHEKRRPYLCPHCPHAAYTSSSQLKRHLMRHTDERPHCCPVCVKRFRTSGELKVYVLVQSLSH